MNYTVTWVRGGGGAENAEWPQTTLKPPLVLLFYTNVTVIFVCHTKSNVHVKYAIVKGIVNVVNISSLKDMDMATRTQII